MEIFIFSKIWYLAQALPLPSAVAQQITAAAGTFLWRGGVERLAWQELHRPLLEGALAISCIRTRAQALWAKQACWAIGNGGQAAGHLAFWLGGLLEDIFPALAEGQHAQRPPRSLANMVEILEELVVHGTVEVAHLSSVTAKNIYLAFTDTLPLPKVEFRLPDLPWDMVWRRLWRRGLPQEEVDLAFKLIHNILPLRARLGRFMGLGVAANCPACPGEVEDSLHAFCTCERVREVWEETYARLVAHLPGVPSNQELLLLAFAEGDRDEDVVIVVLAFMKLVWEARGAVRPPSFGVLEARLRARPPPFRMLW